MCIWRNKSTEEPVIMQVYFITKTVDLHITTQKNAVHLEIFRLKIFCYKKETNIKHPDFPLLTFELESICKGPDPNPTEVTGKILLAHACLFLTLLLVYLPRTFSSTSISAVPFVAGGCLTRPFTAQICVEFQVGLWLFKLFYSTALASDGLLISRVRISRLSALTF